MMMKSETLKGTFSHGVVIPLTNNSHAVVGVSSTSSVTSTPSGRPPLQPRPSQHGGGYGRAGCALSRLGDPREASSVTSGQGIDLNRTPTAGLSSPAGQKKQLRISTIDMTSPANLFNGITGEQDGKALAHLL
jgi:hypothetical protein